MRFELTENHIKLLNRMYVYFDNNAYDGAPAVDIKRPYGNRSVELDIFEIINGKEWNDDNEMPSGIRAELINFHRETSTALQVVLAGMFPGGLGVHSDELYTASDALRAAATACELAAILHEKDTFKMCSVLEFSRQAPEVD